MCKLRYYTIKDDDLIAINVNKRKDRAYFWIMYRDNYIAKIVVWIDEEEK